MTLSEFLDKNLIKSTSLKYLSVQFLINSKHTCSGAYISILLYFSVSSSTKYSSKTSGLIRKYL